LIDPITGQWDATILGDLFNPVHIGRILQIPINNQGFDDFVAWSLTRMGVLRFDLHTMRNGDINSVALRAN
jgi:hypothetical protein